MGLSRILSNGFEIVVKASGKQTLTQVFDEAGNLVKTRLKSVEKSVVPPIRQKKIGFAVNSEQESPAKNIFTITKNEYNHATQESAASILDRVYINGERIGERIISAEGNGNAMEAMKCIKHDGWREEINKILRFFKDGKIVKENQYEFVGYKRRSRYNVDFELEKEIGTLKAKLDKIKFNDIESIQKKVQDAELKLSKIKEQQELSFYEVTNAERQFKIDKSYYDTLQTVNKLLTQEFKTEQEFNTILKEVEKIKDKHNNCIDRTLNDIYDLLSEDINITTTLKNDLKGYFSRRDGQDFQATLSYAKAEVEKSTKILKNTKKKISNRNAKLNSEKQNLEDELEKLSLQINKCTKQNVRLAVQQQRLIEQLKGLEAKREPLTLRFNGSHLRADIDGIDFTL